MGRYSSGSQTPMNITSTEQIPEGQLSLIKPVQRARGLEGQWVERDALLRAIRSGNFPPTIWLKDPAGNWVEARLSFPEDVPEPAGGSAIEARLAGLEGALRNLEREVADLRVLLEAAQR